MFTANGFDSRSPLNLASCGFRGHALNLIPSPHREAREKALEDYIAPQPPNARPAPSTQPPQMIRTGAFQSFDRRDDDLSRRGHLTLGRELGTMTVIDSVERVYTVRVYQSTRLLSEGGDDGHLSLGPFLESALVAWGNGNDQRAWGKSTHNSLACARVASDL